MLWKTRITACKAGSIGVTAAESHNYFVLGDDRDAAVMASIRRGHANGLQHVTVIRQEATRAGNLDWRGLLPICKNRVAVWLDDLPPRFADAQSFRHMIAFAKEDRDGLVKAFANADRVRHADIMADHDADLHAADAIISAMETRLSEIIAHAPR